MSKTLKSSFKPVKLLIEGEEGLGILGKSLLVLASDQPVTQALVESNMTSLSHEFDFFYYYGEVHRDCRRAKGKGCELEILILITESEMLPWALSYRDVKIVGVAKRYYPLLSL